MEEIYRDITTRMLLYFNYWIETDSDIDKTNWCNARLGNISLDTGAKADIDAQRKWSLTGAPDFNRSRYYFVDVDDYIEFMLRFG